MIIINVENSRAAQYFCGNRDVFYFSDEQSSKEMHSFETAFVTL